MARQSKKGKAVQEIEPSSETRLKARPVSRGIGAGRVVWLHGDARQFFKVDLRKPEIKKEIDRLRKAVETARKQLKRLAATERAAASSRTIFETHLSFLDDPSLPSRFEEAIRSDRVNAEWAIKQVTDEYVAKLKSLPDENLRDRYLDIEDVSERILNALEEVRSRNAPFEKDSVIVAHEIRPSTLIEIAASNPRALITENGGWTSHTFIIARDLKIPAVTGLRKQIRSLEPGLRVLVDGYTGSVILEPSDQGSIAEGPSAVDIAGVSKVAELDNGSVMTLDRQRVGIFVNSDSAEAYERAAGLEVSGVGLYRSEFLFDRGRGFPSEEIQIRAYKAIAAAVGSGGVKIRTFDVGPERALFPEKLREHNPSLGLRAIRFSLSNRRILRTQLRAILRAAGGNTVDIVLPMVSGVGEVREVRELLAEESGKLTRAGKTHGQPRLGAMIELPSAVFMADELIAETDFVCLGTNDLIQYVLGADRDNESVSPWYRTLHPAVLRAIKVVVSTASRQQKQMIVCGEMAGSPFYVPILVGLGAADLSMNVNSVPSVCRVIAGVAREECTTLAQELLQAATADEAEHIAERHAKESWRHLFPKELSFG